MIREHPLQDFIASRPPHIVALVLGAALAFIAALLGLSLAFVGPIYTVGLFVALVGAVWMFAGLHNALLAIILIIALLPYGTLPVKIVFTPTFLDIAMLVFFFLYIGEWMTGYRRKLTVTPIHAILVLFILISIFSFIVGLRNAGITSTVARGFAEYVLSMLFALVLVDVLREPEDLKRVVFILMVAGSITALLGAVFWIMPDTLTESLLMRLSVIGYPENGIIQYIEQNPDLPERAISMWANPNSLGGFLVMVAALVGPQMMAEHTITGKRWHSLLMLGLIVLCLVLTFSRGSMLAFGAALVFIAALRYRKLLLILAVIALLILVLPWTQFYVLRLVEGFQGADLATQMRFGEYRDALQLISRYPLFGVGFTGTPDIDLYIGVSNVYLTIASNMGLLGLTAFLVLVVAIFMYGWRARHTVDLVPGLRPILLGLLAGLVGAMANGVFDHYFFNIGFHPAVTILWTFVGMALAAARIAIEAGENTARSTPQQPVEIPGKSWQAPLDVVN